jgi:Xaa-Pro dipeptidase
MYDWPRVDEAALLADRRARVAAVMKEERLDALLLSGFDNIRYATSFRASLTYDSNYEWYAALLDKDLAGTLLACDIGEPIDGPVPGNTAITRRVGAPSWQAAWAQPRTYAQLIERELRGARRVGVDVLQFDVADALRQDGVELVPVAQALLRQRMVKTADEIRLVEASCEVASLAMSAAMRGFVEGMTDVEIVNLANDVSNRCGVEWISHAVITVQATPSRASWLPTGRRVWAGDTFFVDYGVYGAGGYASDFCRTHVAETAPPQVREAHRRLREALAEGEAMARPGVRGSEVAAAVNAALQQRGLPPTSYAMGHGIGLRLVEPPSLFRPDRMDADEMLAEGMTVCIEPSTAVEVGGEVVGLKEEEQYVVTATGLRQLTKTAVEGRAT